MLKLLQLSLLLNVAFAKLPPAGEPLNILFCSGFGTASHTKPLLEYAVNLRQRGHNITFAALKEFEKLVQKHHFNYVLASPEELIKTSETASFIGPDMDYNSLEGLKKMLSMYQRYYIHIYKGLMGWFSERKKENKLPNVVVADFFASACFSFAEMYDIPVISSASAVLPMMAAYPSNLNIKNLYETIWLSKLPIWKRFQRLVLDKVKRISIFRGFQKSLAKLQAEANIPQKNPFSLMAKKVLLANSFHPFTPSARYASSCKLVGPVMPSIYDELTENLKLELDQLFSDQKRGVLIAFGSTAILGKKSFLRLYEGLIQALDAGIIHRVYWGVGRIQRDFLSEINDTRIAFSSWLPQYSMLQHPAIELFVTHGGAESLHESMYSGTPMLAIPVFAEQPGNAVRITELGLGKTLHKSKFVANDIVIDLKTILEDEKEKYHHNLNVMRDIAHLSSRRGLELAVNTIETTGMYGDDIFLFEPSRNWVKNNDIDIMVISLGVLIVLILFLRMAFGY